LERHTKRRSSRPHGLIQTLKLLRTLTKGPRHTMAMYRQLKNDAGFRNYYAFYRQLNHCLKYALIELLKVHKRWGIPTKTYHLTERGKELLRMFDSLRDTIHGA